MDATGQQRILQVLTEAQGDPARLALASVNLTYPDFPEAEIEILREALLAAAVPHWFDAAFLTTLLETTHEAADVLMERLQALSLVEGFYARGPSACNVHEASRLPLREYLRTTQPDLWQKYAQRARDHVASNGETHYRIEALYHQFAADPDAAVNECDALDRMLSQDPAKRSALCFALTELLTAGWLNGAALVEAQRSPLWHRLSRGEASQLGKEAQDLLNLSLQYSHPSGIAESYCLLGDVHVVHGELALAHNSFSESLKIARELALKTPEKTAWQRDLAVFLARLGDVAVTQGDLAKALSFYSENKQILEQLASNAPADASMQRELAISLSKLGDVAQTQGHLDEAHSNFKVANDILESIGIREPTNAIWQRELAVSQARLGSLAMVQKDYPCALQCFSNAKAYIERLVAGDPSNASLQIDLSVFLAELGTVEGAQGNIGRALNYVNKAKLILKQLAARTSADFTLQRELSAILNKLGDLAASKEDLAGAFQSYSESQAIRSKLTASDPTNTLWQHDLSISYYLIATKIFIPQKRWLRALDSMQRSLEIDERLAATDSSNAGWQNDLHASRQILEFLRKKSGRKKAH